MANTQTVPKMYLVHLGTQYGVSAQYNPTTWKESFEAVWQGAEVQGATGVETHYSHTKNVPITLDLVIDGETNEPVRFFGGLGGAAQELTNAPMVRRVRNFLRACCYPMAGGTDIRSGSPSRLLFVWPNEYSHLVKLHKVDFAKEDFFPNAEPSTVRATLNMETVHQRRRTFLDVLENGMQIHDLTAEG